MLIDSHCHLDYEDTDLTAVLANAETAGVGKLLAIGIGDGPATMHRALDLAHRHPQIWATAGIHPQEAHNASLDALAKLATLVADPRCVAVGEIGLDYYHFDNPEVDMQQAAFVAQLKIAAAARKPITIHVRTSELATPEARARYEGHGKPEAAWDDLLRLLGEHWQPHGIAGIMHCFSGNESQAAAALAMGFYLSFAGNVTYARSATIQQVARTMAADRMLVETDAPFLAPVPLRGTKNEPGNVALTAAFVAELRGVAVTEIAEQTTANFHRLFPETAGEVQDSASWQRQVPQGRKPALSGGPMMYGLKPVPSRQGGFHLAMWTTNIPEADSFPTQQAKNACRGPRLRERQKKQK